MAQELQQPNIDRHITHDVNIDNTKTLQTLPEYKLNTQNVNPNSRKSSILGGLASTSDEDSGGSNTSNSQKYTNPSQSNNTISSNQLKTKNNASTPKKKKNKADIMKIATKEAGADFVKDYQKTQRVVRNNPWGQFSYKDMITDAILSKRGYKAKLSDIYEYMINHYEYFNKRQDMEGRKQWSNSVRHNLSSHKDLFVNEKEDASRKPFGTKLGGYWSLTPDKLEIALKERADKSNSTSKR